MIPQFDSREKLFDYLRANKSMIITAKKSRDKYADAVHCPVAEVEREGEVIKAAANVDLLNLPEFKVKSVINTTNLLDSHGDVHIPGIWKKSLQESKQIYLLQEHVMQFDHVISDKVQARAKSMTWAELGYNWPGVTEALVFESTVEKAVNPFMAEQYAKGRVNNHSVGMRYVKIQMAMNSESKYDQEEKAVWDKYYPQIINQSEADERGYFFAVTEAKVIEGSAVLRGSNFVTPTISIGKQDQSPLDNEADQVTSPEPVNWSKVAQSIKQSLKN